MSYLQEKHETEIMFKKLLRNRRRRGKEFFGNNGCYLSPIEFIQGKPPPKAETVKKYKEIQLKLDLFTIHDVKQTELIIKNVKKHGTIKKSKRGKSTKNKV